MYTNQAKTCLDKKIDLIGTTLVLMKDGKILQEQDFFDNYSLLSHVTFIIFVSFSFAIFSISSEKTLGVCKSIITPLYVWGYRTPTILYLSAGVTVDF